MSSDQNSNPAVVESTTEGQVGISDLTGDNTFESSVPIVGLTSSIDEFVHIGRDQFMQVFEEALGDVVVLQVECNINGMLQDAEVYAPHNESISTTGTPIEDVDLAAVGKFEWHLKNQNGVDKKAQWSELSGTSTANQGGKKLYQQVRSFLGDFFDHDKELNAIVAQTSSSDPRALVLLDDDKIKAELANLKNTETTDGQGYDTTGEPGTENVQTTYFPSNDVTKPLQPRDRKCFATNLLSVRQIAQVLEAFAAMGVGNSNSRVVREVEGNQPNYTGNFLYRLHEGDSIIGECKVFDSDAVSTDKQYSQVIKVQIVQSAEGKYVESDNVTIGPDGENPTWDGNDERIRAGDTATITLKDHQPEKTFEGTMAPDEFVQSITANDSTDLTTGYTIEYVFTDLKLDGMSVEGFTEGSTALSAGTYTFYVTGTATHTTNDTPVYSGTSTLVTVVVADTVAPVIINTIVSASAHNTETYTPKTGVTATDDVDGDLTNYITYTTTLNDITTTFNESATLSVGRYVFTYTVSDTAGNEATPVTRTLTVTDGVAPTIINSKSDEEWNAGTVYDPLNGVSAEDDISVPSLTYTSDVAFNTSDPQPGRYKFSYTATDAAGNSTTLTESRTLTVYATSVTGSNRVVDATNLYPSAFNGRWDTGDNFNNGCALLSSVDNTPITLDGNTVNSHYGYIYKSHTVAVTFNTVALHTRGQQFDPQGFTFIGSDDGSTWTTLFSGTRVSHTIIYDPDTDAGSDPAHDPVTNILYDPNYSLWTQLQSVTGDPVTVKHIGILVTTPSNQSFSSIIEVRFE
ncbi:hypothetical protein N9C24_04900 [Gammaproteobacteria bacterium]|nr:hypothetical protein [Gammaproteobacteria bacterium]